MNYVYILRCSDNTLYTGWTNNLYERLKKHNEGNGAKYTRARLPVELVYVEEYETKSEAMKREYQIKKMSRRKKLLLIES
ncbi:MAG: GIY-YIG nuclease family protein, partial [Andreesenia angusta]|nr:GIY-YIG nuclease family protein [Andreesenia angusta]